MSADFTTYIKFSGKEEDIRKALMVVNGYTDDSREIYILSPTRVVKGSFFGEPLGEEPVIENGKLDITFSGPYGRFGLLEEINLFDEIAEASPKVNFNGQITGWNTGGRQTLSAVYRKQKLIYDFEVE